VVENVTDYAIFVLDPCGHVVTWNEGAQRMKGYQASEIIGQHFSIFYPREIALSGFPERELVEAERLGRFEDEGWRVRKDGTTFWANVIITAVRDAEGTLRGFAKVTRDLTERKKAEETLAESKARLAGIVSSAMDAIILLDQQLSITMFNPAAEHLFLAQASEAIGSPIDRFIPDIGAHLPTSAESGAATRFESVGFRTGSRRCELEISAARMEAAGHRFFSVIARDVTGRKELERLLLQKDKLESLGLLAGGIAHDFNNLLVGIMGNTSLAAESISGNHPARPMLKDVMAASEAAGNLTRQLLAYAGKGRFLIESVDVSDLIRQIAGLMQTSIPKSVQLRLELAPELPAVEADVTQLQQLIMNLVINGAEAIGKQPGTVLITTASQQVDDDYIATVMPPEQISPGLYVNLQVHDTGSGMTPETIEKIYDPFFTTKFTGRGLGLAAVLGIVRGHRGAIKVYSTPGQGTTFKILLPAAGQHVAKAEEAPATPATGSGETVLVVDDERIVRRTAKTMLEQYGYSVVLAENGREAVELYRVLADKIALILLDMTMPLMGGEETFRELKIIRPDVRVVLSSGYNEVEAVPPLHRQGSGWLHPEAVQRNCSDRESPLCSGRIARRSTRARSWSVKSWRSPSAAALLRFHRRRSRHLYLIPVELRPPRSDHDSGPARGAKNCP
jgi:PAS domain S-box-containing protein